MTLSRTLRLLLACLGMFGVSAAQAIISCTATAAAVQSVYFENDTNPTDGTWSVTINCTRGTGAFGNPSTSAYTLRVDDGLDVGGGSNRATNGAGAANRINYELYRVAPGSGVWSNAAATDFDGTINFGTALTASVTLTFYSRITAGQNKNAKIFIDTVGMALRYNNGVANTTSNSSIAVAINNTSLCLLATPPPTLSFNYTSFQATPATANVPYIVRCTLNETYVMTLDSAGGTLLNLNYTLGLSNPGNRLGTGLPENFTINGSIAAGQSGRCATGSCTSSNPHVLTISY